MTMQGSAKHNVDFWIFILNGYSRLSDVEADEKKITLDNNSAEKFLGEYHRALPPFQNCSYILISAFAHWLLGYISLT